MDGLMVAVVEYLLEAPYVYVVLTVELVTV
jgi:hypothetical protein